jgi:hypothetical protein
MSEIVQLKYNGTALPAAAETVVIFSTVSAGMGAGQAQRNGMKKLCLVIDNDATCTANLYAGTNAVTPVWTMVTTTTLAATGTTSTNNYEWIISSMPHFKLEVVVGAATVTAFSPMISLVDERAT